MAISFDNFFPKIIGSVLFLAICGAGIFILFKIGTFVFKRLKNTDPVVKCLTIIGLLFVLFFLLIVTFWGAFFALYYIGGGGPLR